MSWLGVEALSGHLSGVPVPAGGQVIEASYAPTYARVVLSGVPCSPGIPTAFAQSLGPGGFNPVPSADLIRVQHADGRAIAVTCESGRGRDVVSVTSEGAMSQGWNPWNLPDWRIGPFSMLPPVSTGATYKPHIITLSSTESVAALTPKSPSRFIERLGQALTEAEWTPRPLPGGTAWSIRDDALVVSTEGAMVDLRLTKSP